MSQSLDALTPQLNKYVIISIHRPRAWLYFADFDKLPVTDIEWQIANRQTDKITPSPRASAAKTHAIFAPWLPDFFTFDTPNAKGSDIIQREGCLGQTVRRRLTLFNDFSGWLCRCRPAPLPLSEDTKRSIIHSAAILPVSPSRQPEVVTDKKAHNIH